jgi:hypothetical protein
MGFGVFFAVARSMASLRKKQPGYGVLLPVRFLFYYLFLFCLPCLFLLAWQEINYENGEIDFLCRNLTYNRIFYQFIFVKV